MGCFVNFGADWHGPGRDPVRQPRRRGGRRDRRRIRERTREMHALLPRFEPDAVLTDNIWGYLWGKLAYGAMLFATALTTDSMARQFRRPAPLHRVRRARPRGDGRGRGARRHAGRLQRLRSGGLRCRAPARTRPRVDRCARRIQPRTPPRPIPASTATWPCASARPRSTRRSASSPSSAREAGVATPALGTAGRPDPRHRGRPAADVLRDLPGC